MTKRKAGIVLRDEESWNSKSRDQDEFKQSKNKFKHTGANAFKMKPRDH